MNALSSFAGMLNGLVATLRHFYESSSSISEETMEKYKSISGLKPKEIARLQNVFKTAVGEKDILSREGFLSMEGIINNPLKDRISYCFGYDDENAGLDFEGFLAGVGLFNSPGKREMKLKTAFKIQDFDNDGTINKQDLITYIQCVTAKTLNEKELDEVAQSILAESSSDANKAFLSFNDFRKVTATLDFQAKLILPI